MNQFTMHKEKELIKEILSDVISDISGPDDHFLVENHNVWYSRFYGGGAFNSLCSVSFNLTSTKIIIEFNTTRNRATIDLSEPDSLERLGELIKLEIKHVQPERTGQWLQL